MSSSCHHAQPDCMAFWCSKVSCPDYRPTWSACLPSLTSSLLHISHSSTLACGTVDYGGVPPQGLCTGYSPPPITLYQLLPFNFYQLTLPNVQLSAQVPLSVEIFLDGPCSTFHPTVLMSYCNCTLFMWLFLPWVSSLCQVVSSMRVDTKFAWLTTHLLATGKRYPRYTYYINLLASSWTNGTPERGFWEKEGLACPCWQEACQGVSGQFLATRVLSQGSPLPSHLLPWKEFPPLETTLTCLQCRDLWPVGM